MSFNSQPHEEADKMIEAFRAIIIVSTHSLTRRLTKFFTINLQV